MKNRVITFATLFVFAFATVFNCAPGFASGELSGPALEQLIGISGAATAEAPADTGLRAVCGAVPHPQIYWERAVPRAVCGAVPPSAAQAGETVLPVPVKAIPPGSDLLPYFSDPGRVKVILKVIEDVYYERPFPYPQDGTVFHNREKLLPLMPKGYYREYTVIPPENSPSIVTVGGQSYYIPNANGHRGVERLVIGGGETAYYTPVHYMTFIQLTVIR